MNACPPRSQLQAMVADSLSGTTKQDILSHLNTCAQCRNTLNELAQPDAATTMGWQGAPGAGSAADVTQAPATGTGGSPSVLPAPFGRYQLRKLLGKGGMGSVYLAHDTQLDRPVALKIPLLAGAEDAQVLARFYREAQAAAALHHPNICPTFDVGSIDSVPYLTMAFIEGKPLAEYAAGRALPPRQIAFLVRKLALALHEAHKRGVVHRDLKPANIMIDKRGEPIIMDFGLARRARQGDARLTQLGQIMGTPAYMPPEQINGDIDAMGPACDIYSLGVILYELLAGRLPFSGDAMAMLAQVLMDQPPPPSQFRPDVDKQLQAVCLKAMAKKVADRYASMAEIAAALTDYLQHKTMVPQARETTAPAPPPVPVVPPVKSSAKRTLNAPPPVEARRSATSSRARPPRRNASDGLRRWLWPIVAGGAAAGLLLLVLGIWIAYRVTDYGTIRFKLSEPAAVVAITVDEELPHRVGESLSLRAGQHHVVTVTGDDYWPVSVPFTVDRGVNREVLVPLNPKFGHVQIALSDATAPVQVRIDGVPTSVADLQRPLRLKVADHNLDVSGWDYERINQPFTIHGDPNPAVSVALQRNPPVDLKPGLRVEYFQGANFEHKVHVQLDPQVNLHGHALFPPHKAIPPGAYSVRWTGWLKAPKPGRYKLIAHVDDGVRVTIDGKLLIDQWHAATPRDYEAVANLTGKFQALRIEFLEIGIGGSVLQLFWEQSAERGRELIPAASLFHDPATFERVKAWLPEDEKRYFTAEPKDTKTALMRAEAFYHQGKYDEALADYRRWRQLLPPGPTPAADFGAEYYNHCAWQLATGPKRQPRFADAAVALAERACQLAPTNYMYIDTLAAAYAFRGDFARAIDMQEQALRLAPNDRKADFAARLDLYRSNKTYSTK